MGEVTASRELLPALGRVPGHVFWRASARIAVTASELVPDLDLLAYAALHALPDPDTGATGAAVDIARSQQELADAIAVSRTTMVKVAGDLAQAGLVDRVRNPGDRRSYLLTRTATGATRLRSWDAEVDRLEAAVTAAYDETERSAVLAMLRRLAEAALTPDLPAAVRDRVSLLVPRVHQWLYREFDEALAPVGLEPRHLGALVALGDLGPVSQGELARAIGISAASAVVLADELEERGLVERRRAPGDRRTQVLHLTATAAGTTSRARAVGRATADRLLGLLGADERERLVALLRRMVTAT